MSNPFWELYRLSNQTQEEIAGRVGISRPTLRTAIRAAGPEDSVKVGTMRMLAAHFGQRVVITLEPMEADNANHIIAEMEDSDGN